MSLLGWRIRRTLHRRLCYCPSVSYPPTIDSPLLFLGSSCNCPLSAHNFHLILFRSGWHFVQDYNSWCSQLCACLLDPESCGCGCCRRQSKSGFLWLLLPVSLAFTLPTKCKASCVFVFGNCLGRRKVFLSLPPRAVTVATNKTGLSYTR